MSKIVLNTVMAVALATSSLAMTTGAFAQSPTQARVNAQKSAKLQKYYPCAEFALRVFKACSTQAGGNSTKVRACRRHYSFSLGQCRRYAGL